MNNSENEYLLFDTFPINEAILTIIFDATYVLVLCPDLTQCLVLQDPLKELEKGLVAHSLVPSTRERVWSL